MKPASNKAADLLAAAPLKFTPVEDFYSEEFRSAYVTGLEYTLRIDRELNEHYERDFSAELAGCMEQWLDAGKITLIDPSKPTGSTASSSVAGSGTVT